MTTATTPTLPLQSSMKLTENELKTQGLVNTLHTLSPNKSTPKSRSPKLTLQHHHPSIHWNNTSYGNSNNAQASSNSLFDDDLDHDNYDDNEYSAQSFTYQEEEEEEQEEHVEEEEYNQESFAGQQEDTAHIGFKSSHMFSDMDDDEYVFDIPLSSIHHKDSMVSQPHIATGVSTDVTTGVSTDSNYPITPLEPFEPPESPPISTPSTRVVAVTSSSSIVQGPVRPCSFSEQELEDLFTLIESQHEVLVKKGLVT